MEQQQDILVGLQAATSSERTVRGSKHILAAFATQITPALRFKKSLPSESTGERE